MGINYTLRQTPCSTCARSDEIHIGKKSGGWSFSFHGYRHDPDDGLFSPFGVPVLSRADWLKVLNGFDGAVFDEDNRQVEDPVEWLRRYEAPDLKQQRWEDDHMGSFWHPDQRDWRDPEGFRFYDGEFS